ncbi:MAG: branched-chain amino acid transport system ATP-binding protein, partial [Methylobacteriaceae bacterium]|nr:branched-chain amino acid transport system ATP-binding protein [Methylobacteriaceae bacterium]
VDAMADMMVELKKTGVAIVLSEQNLPFAELVSDRAYVIEKGELRFSGTMQALSANEELRRAYLEV